MMVASKAAAHNPRVVHKYQNYYFGLFSVILIGLIVVGLYKFWPHSLDHDDYQHKFVLAGLESASEMIIPSNSPESSADQNCNYYTCFDVYKYGQFDNNRINVYIYDLNKYVDDKGVPITIPISREFHDILIAILESGYYTHDPSKACVFIPAVDLLNQNHLRLKETGYVLASLPYWNDEVNHLLFNMLPGSIPDYNTVLDINREKAMISGGGFSSWTYRQGFDISIPVYNPLVMDIANPERPLKGHTKWLAVSSQLFIHHEYRQELKSLAEEHLIYWFWNVVGLI